MRKTLVYLIILTLFTIGCGKEKADQIAENLKDKGTMDVLKQAGEDEYDPPEDGKLTDDQMEMYLEVRKHEVEIARVARKQFEEQAEKVKEKGDKSLTGMMEAVKGLGSAADFLTADIRAAQELGYNTNEYMWIKGQVIQASAAEYTEKATAQLEAMADQTYINMKKQYEETTDENTKAMLGQALEEMEKNRSKIDESRKELDEATLYNRELISKYEDTLTALATEASKWNDKDKDPDELTDEMRKALEKSSTTEEK